VAIGLLTGHTNLTVRVQTRIHTAAGLTTVSDEKKSQQCSCCMSLFGKGMQKIQKIGSYVFQTQGSRKHEGEQPYLPTA
jgi:hypothetical protein